MLAVCPPVCQLAPQEAVPGEWPVVDQAVLLVPDDAQVVIDRVVEDDLVSIDWLIEKIQENEDLVQSVDIAAFQKI